MGRASRPSVFNARLCISTHGQVMNTSVNRVKSVKEFTGKSQ